MDAFLERGKTQRRAQADSRALLFSPAAVAQTERADAGAQKQ